MTIREYASSFAVSPLGIACAALAAGAGLAVGLAAGAPAGLGAALAAFAALAILAAASGVGPRAAAAERERRARASNLAALSGARAAADRLASLRMPDPEAKRLAGLVALRARAYLDACARTGSRDPRADLAVEESLALLGNYLEELDDDSTERRYGLPDDDRFEGAATRVRAALLEKAALLERAVRDLGDGLERSERMGIEEDLR